MVELIKVDGLRLSSAKLEWRAQQWSEWSGRASVWAVGVSAGSPVAFYGRRENPP
jgi:hypothetical protein